MDDYFVEGFELNKTLFKFYFETAIWHWGGLAFLLIEAIVTGRTWNAVPDDPVRLFVLMGRSCRLDRIPGK